MVIYIEATAINVSSVRQVHKRKRENKSPIEITTINSHVMPKLEKCANTILTFVNMKFIITLFQIICSSPIFIYCSNGMEEEHEDKFCVVHK